MKKLNFMLLILVISLAGCVEVNCNSCDDADSFDLSHYYEPHVTIMHEIEDDEESHFYSVMLIVEKDVKVYVKKKNTGEGVYDVEYYFRKEDGAEPAKEINSYAINANYEVRMYKYPIEYVGMEKAAKSATVDEGTRFIAKVNAVPPGHPHDDPIPLHEGTIHRPGVGGGGVVED